MSDWGFSAFRTRFLLTIWIRYLLLNLIELAKTRSVTVQELWICCVYPRLIIISSVRYCLISYTQVQAAKCSQLIH